MYAIDSIAIQSVDDNKYDGTEPKRWAMAFAIVSDEHETNCVSPASTRFQPDTQSLASSALLSNQSLVACLSHPKLRAALSFSKSVEIIITDDCRHE
jgi:hypothetical protein